MSQRNTKQNTILNLPKSYRYSIGLFAIIFVAVLAAWFDIRPVLTAHAKLDALTSPAALADVYAKTTKEMNAFENCAKSSSTDEYHSCAILELSAVETDWFASIAIGLIRPLLSDHPEDVELRTAARKAVIAGWAELERTRPLSDAARELDAAVANSKLIPSSYDTQTKFWDRKRRMGDLRAAEAMLSASRMTDEHNG
jgi:hypothetical protein